MSNLEPGVTEGSSLSVYVNITDWKTADNKDAHRCRKGRVIIEDRFKDNLRYDSLKENILPSIGNYQIWWLSSD